ncbi:MAG: PspC domain-containing protein [Propionibacteriaceae bacterium]
MSSIWTMRRNTTDAKVAGVCSGLARHADVDPVIVRVGAVLLALSGGIGLVAYAAAWLFVPDERGRALIDEHLPAARRWPRPLLVVALVAACLVVASLLSPVLPFGIGSALVLAAIWYFGYYKNRPPSSEGSSPAATSAPAVAAQPGAPFATFSGPPTPFTEAAAAWQRRMAEVQRIQQPTAAPPPVWPVAGPQTPGPTSWPPADPKPWAPADPTPWAFADPTPVEDPQQAFLTVADPVGLYVDPPAPTTIAPHRRTSARRLRLVSVAVLGLTLAGLAVADAAGVAIGVSTYLAAALLVGGLTLLASGWLGRARGILPITVLVALATLGSSAAAAAHLEDWGRAAPVYTTQSEMPRTDDLYGGDLRVNLTNLPVTRDQTYAATVGYGQLALIRPTASNVRIVWSVGEGLATTPSGDTSGQDLKGTIEPTGVTSGSPVLTVTLRVDHGRLEVR